MAWTHRYVTATGAGDNSGDSSDFSDAMTLAQAIADAATPHAGYCYNIKAGTYALTSATAFSGAGSTSAPIWWRGCKATAGDLDDGVTIARTTPGTDLPLITGDADAQITITGESQIFSYLDISSVCVTANGAVYATAGSTWMIGCRIENTQAGQANAKALSCATTNPVMLIGCRFKATTDAAHCVNFSVRGMIMGCHIIGGAIGIRVGEMNVLTGCVIESFGSAGITSEATTHYHTIANNTIYAAATNGIRLDTTLTTGGIGIVNNIIGGCTNGINSTAATTGRLTLYRNHFYNVTNHLVGITENADVTSELGILGRLIDNNTDPWVNKAANDFTLAAGNTIDKSAGFPGTFEGQTAMVGYPDMGAVQAKNQFEKLGVFGLGAVTKESGANARGGSGTCIKFNPSSATIQLYWNFLIPVTASTEFTLHFWHKITTDFNGSVKVSIYDSDDDATLLLSSETVTLTNDGDYNEYTATAETPTDTGFCRVRIEVLDGSTTGDVYIDDITVV